MHTNDFIKYSKDLTLLYVEDDPFTREMTSMILEDFFHTVIVAVNGLDGYEKFQHNKIDVVLTDINMSKMNGLAMCEKIRAKNEMIPLVVLSAHNEENFFLESIKIGINGYVLKPVDIKQLSNVFSQVLQRCKYARDAKENLYFLEEYKKAINESSIVSKTDLKGIITYVNDAFCKISGYTKEELLGKNHNIVRYPDNPKSLYKELWHTIKDKKQIWKGTLRNKAKSGKSYYVSSVVMPVLNLNGEILEYISLRNDITDIVNPLKQLQDELDNAKNPFLILLKLEDFQELEEFYDTKTIQEIEQKVQKYLEEKLSHYYPYDTLYSLEHGEYAFILNANLYKENIEEFIVNLKNLQAQIKEDKIPFDIIEYDIAVLISLAYEKNKIYKSVTLGMKQLLNKKENFILANNLATLEQEKAKKNMQTISMIKDALKASRIVSYFQPIIDNTTQKTVKYESLVRLIDNEGKVLSPFFFLDIAKKSNYYLKITDVVLEHSFSMLYHCDADISINLSALDIEQKNMCQKIITLLEKHKEQAHRIVFELLEDEKIKDFKIVKKFITTIKEYGVKIAIDDFGTGYSNFERLLEYQPDILKIDGCLIRDIVTSSYSNSVVKSIVTFAKEQNLQTVAEFIEDEEIFNIVKSLGVDFSQGYYFGKPEPL